MAENEGRQVVVDARELRDLLELVDRIIERSVDDLYRDKANIRDIPLAELDGLRGAAAQVRVHACEPA